MKRILSISLLFCMMLGIQAFGQSKRITGTVTDLFTGETLPGVTVVLKGTTVGTQTNMDGRYELTVPEGSTLVFSFVGMMSEEIVVDERSIIDVALSADIATLSEVIIVAYGTTTRESFTGALSTIESDKLENRPIANISTAIEGSAPGIQVTSASGQPGSDQNIRIRGVGSFSASNAPLYVVDGVPYPNALSNLNAADIESISVLKDAAATSLYGNRAANGVIIITTKSGRKNQEAFNFRVSTGVSQRSLPEYERVGANDYYPLMWETRRNSIFYDPDNALTIEQAGAQAANEVYGLLGYNPYNVDNNAIVDANGQLNPNARLIYSASDLDWQDAMMRVGGRTDVSMSYSGGTDKTDFYVSMGYLDEKGYVLQSDFNRLVGRMNVNTQVNDWFRTGLNISGTRSASDNTNTDSSTGYANPFYFTRNMGPIYPVYAQRPGTGEYILDDAGNKIYDLGTMGELGLPNRINSPGRHVIAETLWNVRDFTRNVISARTFGEVKFLDYFTFTTNIGMDINSYAGSGYDNNIVGDGAPAGRARRTNTLTQVMNFNQLLNYNRSFGIHNLDVLLGHESYEYDYDYLYSFKQGLIVEGNTELINFTDINTATSYVHKYRSEGYFSRLNYNYDNRYFFSGSFRRDGSSKFYQESRWGNFWSLSGAWRLDREDFMSGINGLDMLKPRISYGQVGNDAGISYYAYQALYTLGRNNAGEPGFVQASLSSPDLVWEANTSMGIGVDFILFGRVSGNLDFFRRESSNLLFEVPLPISSGMSSRDQNIGTMHNQGIELRLATDVVRQQDFNWNVDFNLTSFKNEFTHLPQEEIITGTKKLMVGHSIYDYWLRQWYGVDPEDGSALYFAENTDANNIRIIGGDTLTTDHNNARYGYSGSAIPDLMGGISNTFTYKNFELSFLFTFQVGGKIYDNIYANLMSSGDYGDAKHVDIFNRWQNPGDITDVPRLDERTRVSFGAQSDRWLIDASYLNFRSVNISYNLPQEWTRRWDMKSAAVYVSGENLMLWSARKGLDPQQSFTGVLSNDYTPARIFTLGLNVAI